MLLLLALVPLAALPWGVKFWPGQDDANHLAVAHIVEHFDDSDTRYSDFLTVTVELTPYKLYYFLLDSFSRVVDLVDANRIVVSLVIAGLPLVMLFWLRRIAPERRINVFLVCLLASGWLPFMGFHTYMLSFLIGIAALALAAGKSGADGMRQPAGWGALAGASALLFLSTISHPVAPVMLGGALFVLEAPGRDLRAWLRLAIVGTPAALFLVLTMLATPSAGSLASFMPNFPGILPGILSLLGNLIAFDRLEFLIRLPVLIVLLWGAIRAVRRFGVRGQGRDQCLARVFLVFAVLYFLLPNFPALGFIPDRFGFFALMVAALLPPPLRIVRRPGLFCSAAAIAGLALAAVQYRAAGKLSDKVADVVSAGQVLPRGATVLPLIFEQPPEGARVSSLLHSWGYLVLEKDIITPYLFANSSGVSIAGGNWRPVSYAEPFGPEFLPYIQEFLPVTWRRSEGFITEAGRGLMEKLMLETMAGYERVILISPPEEFLEKALQTMESENRVGDVWVLKPAGDGPVTDAPGSDPSPTPGEAPRTAPPR